MVLNSQNVPFHIVLTNAKALETGEWCKPWTFLGQPCTFIGQFQSRDPHDVIDGHFSHSK